MALVPIIPASLMLVTIGGVSLAFGGDRVVHHVFCTCQTRNGCSAVLV